MRRFTLSLAGLLLVTITAAAAQQAATPPAAAAPQADAAAADENWIPDKVTNLTVLPKETSPADVMKIMRDWNAALNVDCVFCHVGQVGKPLSSYDFASDNKKRKEVSRVMLKASMDMNAAFKTLGDEPPTVMCSTCHKRSRHVEADLPEKPASEKH